MKTAEQMASNYQTAMSSGNTANNYKNGINAYNGNPMERAAAANDKYLQKVQESVSSGRRTARLLAVPVGTWKKNATEVGAARLTSGATKAMDKVRQHFQKFQPVYADISATAANMPNNSIDDALAKVRMSMEKLKAAAGKS